MKVNRNVPLALIPIPLNH